jgi:hypothetical protein
MKTLGTGNNIRTRNGAIMRLSEYSSLREPKDILTRLYGWEN